MGVITIKSTPKTGDVVAIQLVEDADHLLILTSGGRIIRLRMDEISAIGRNTMGRTLVRMDAEEYVVDVARAESSEDEDKDADASDDSDLDESDADASDDQDASEDSED